MVGAEHSSRCSYHAARRVRTARAMGMYAAARRGEITGMASTIRMKCPSTRSWCSIRCAPRPRTTPSASSSICKLRSSSWIVPRQRKVRNVLEFGANRVLSTMGYELRDRVLAERPEGFPGYLEAAQRLGMDVNDYEEHTLGWRLPQPTLDEIVFPYLGLESIVCEIGPAPPMVAPHRRARAIRRNAPGRRLAWMVRFLRSYFRQLPSVQAHSERRPITRVRAQRLDGPDLFSQHAGRIEAGRSSLRPALRAGIEAWRLRRGRLRRSDHRRRLAHRRPRAEMAHVYTFHAPEVIDRVFASAGRACRAPPPGRQEHLCDRAPCLKSRSS